MLKPNRLRNAGIRMKITYEAIKANPSVETYIKKADESLKALGYTEHSFAHVTKVAMTASEILLTLGYDEREAELAKVAGYLHDIGNVINRIDHAQSGAVMAFRILDKMGAEDEDIATIITAIGNHDEATAFPVNPVAAALILADKTDVRYTRVRNQDFASFDIHDRVNYSVKESHVTVRKGECIELNLTVDTNECSVANYFEIFLNRMILCKKAAERLEHAFRLIINGQQLM
ncbi:MAG: HD domain-containing protein [Lachnospiraceae bacterium]|nr:HD domain-containing protein [Lachnospiraceae bacterium]